MLIKAHPTTYAGVNFRSRLEARWAAYFDLNGWQWEYEPIDFDGWSPDFRLTTLFCPVYAEVKPDSDLSRFTKAYRHWREVQVLLLGPFPGRQGIGLMLDPPEDANYAWAEVHDIFQVSDPTPGWREANNRTQWKPVTIAEEAIEPSSTDDEMLKYEEVEFKRQLLALPYPAAQEAAEERDSYNLRDGQKYLDYVWANHPEALQ